MKLNILTWLRFFTFTLKPVNRWPECCWPSSQCYSHVHAACEEALIRGARAWAGALGSVQAELGRLQGLLADYSVQSTPQAELSILLTTGRASPALQQFLCNHLGEPLLLLTYLDTGLCPAMLAVAAIGKWSLTSTVQGMRGPSHNVCCGSHAGRQVGARVDLEATRKCRPYAAER